MELLLLVAAGIVVFVGLIAFHARRMARHDRELADETRPDAEAAHG